MAFRAFCKPAPDVFSRVLDLRRAVFSAPVETSRNPCCASGIYAAVERIAQKVLEVPGDAGRAQLYSLNLALRAMVYDLQDTKAISDAHAEAILSKSFELERWHLMASNLAVED